MSEREGMSPLAQSLGDSLLDVVQDQPIDDVVDAVLALACGVLIKRIESERAAAGAMLLDTYLQQIGELVRAGAGIGGRVN